MPMTSELRHDEIMRARRRAYDNFIEHAATYFGKEPRSVLKVAEIAWAKLQDVKAEAWTKLQDAVVDLWETWPRNLVRAIRQAILDAKIRTSEAAEKTDCPYCDGAGYFIAQKAVEAVMGALVTYSFAWRCAGCKNWVGEFGEKVPAAYPLELKTRGFEIVIPPKPTSSEKEPVDLDDLIFGLAKRFDAKPRKTAWEEA